MELVRVLVENIDVELPATLGEFFSNISLHLNGVVTSTYQYGYFRLVTISFSGEREL